MERGVIELLLAVVGSNVTIMAGAFAVLKRMNSRHQQVGDREDGPMLMPRVLAFMDHTETILHKMAACMDNTEKALDQGSRIQHTQTRYLDDLRQEISALRTQIGELKGMISR